MQKPRWLRTAMGVAVIVVVPMVPGMALAGTELRAATSIWMLAAITVTLGVVLTRVRTGVITGVALAVASFFGYLSASNPWLAMVVMGCSAGLYGLTARRGVHVAITMAPISLGFIMAERIPVVPTAGVAENALFTALVVLGATAWSAPIGWFMAKRLPDLPLHPTSVERARGYAIQLAVVTGIAMWFTVYFQWKHGGAWFLLTLFVVIKPFMHDTWVRALQRALGTVLGFAIAYAVSVLVDAPWLLYAAGVICLGTAVFMYINPHRSYWQYATFLTPAIVLLEGTSTSVVTTDLQRLQFTLLGVLVAFAALALTMPVYRHYDRKVASPPAPAQTGQ